MKYHLINKLFYDKYHYKLDLHLQLAPIFREKKFSYSKEVLDNLQYQYENNNEPTQLIWQKGYKTQEPINVEQFTTAQTLLHELQSIPYYNFKLRVEHPTVSFYTDEYSYVQRLCKNIPIKHIIALHRPPEDTELQPNTILTNNPDAFEYKVTLGPTCSPGLGHWIQANPDKVKAGTVCLDAIKNNQYVAGYYFYVKNEKILNLVKIVVGGKIQRIDKFINNALS